MCPSEIDALVGQCLNVNPDARPSAAEIVERLKTSEVLWRSSKILGSTKNIGSQGIGPSDQLGKNLSDIPENV